MVMQEMIGARKMGPGTELVGQFTAKVGMIIVGVGDLVKGDKNGDVRGLVRSRR